MCVEGAVLHCVGCGQCGLPPCPPILCHRGAFLSPSPEFFRTDNHCLVLSASSKLVDGQLLLLLLQRPAATTKCFRLFCFFVIFFFDVF